ncbi:T9SS type A sorting domain-containing protein [Flavobacterium sp. SM15]|uniref:T9SS type A sorting domain-containing protein n=1 Tax=Flavobacterium sp. SM15 TaxID=2908005 RepID=UPI001EDA4F92|nr:T9SS type A sorting domain-containing protein [Flavobacterium sp. SM15]MCG2610280.1 T9SS type A sorting domain-containing protein [Flavobacterium sp. SM15]
MKIFVLFFCVLQSVFLTAQNPSDPDPLFNASTGFNNNVYKIYVQPDEKILVSGLFTTYQGQSQNSLIRLNADGSKDTSFDIGTGFNQFVMPIVWDNNGKILVGGGFNYFQEQLQNYLIRLNPDGTKDNTFDIGSGFGGYVYALAMQTDGKILVGGNFTSYKGQTQLRLIRLNPDGSKDASFDIGSGLNGVVNHVTILADGKILVAGGFTTYKGQGQKGLIRLNSDGTKDTSFSIGTGFDQSVNMVEVQPDGKILASGWFSTFQGQSQKGLVRLNSDGSKDASFDVGTGFIGSVSGSVLQANGKIILGGQFNSYQGQPQNYLIRLNANGSKDTTFDIETGFDSNIFTLTSQPDGKILAGGMFNSYKGQTHTRLIRIEAGELLSDADFTKEAIVVFPNPVKETLFINTNDGESVLNVQVYDIQGKRILDKEIIGIELDVRDLESGIYLLKIKTANGELTKKIIKND